MPLTKNTALIKHSLIKKNLPAPAPRRETTRNSSTCLLKGSEGRSRSPSHPAHHPSDWPGALAAFPSTGGGGGRADLPGKLSGDTAALPRAAWRKGKQCPGTVCPSGKALRGWETPLCSPRDAAGAAGCSLAFSPHSLGQEGPLAVRSPSPPPPPAPLSYPGEKAHGFCPFLAEVRALSTHHGFEQLPRLLREASRRQFLSSPGLKQ